MDNKTVDDLTYDECLNILNDYHNSNSEKSNKDAYLSLIEMGIIESKFKLRYLGFISIIIIFILGIFATNEYVLFFVGFLFYSIAMLIDKKSKSEIIVIYTHGFIGMVLMVISFIVGTNANNYIPMYSIGSILIILSFIFNTLYYLSPKYNAKEINKYIHYFIAIAGMLIIILTPLVYNILN